MAGFRLQFAPLRLVFGAVWLLLAAWTCTAAAQSQLHQLAGETVAQVRIAAERPIPPEQIPPLTTRVGQPLDVATFNADVARLLASERFIDVRPWLCPLEAGGVVVVFDLVDLRERWGQPAPVVLPSTSSAAKVRFQSPDPLSDINPLTDIEEISRPPDVPPGELVTDVKVTGNEVLSLQKVLALVRTRVGRPFSRDQVDDDVRRMMQSRMFLDVQARSEPAPGGGVQVTYVVVERPMLKEIKFVGNKQIKSSALAKETDLKIGKPLDPYTMDDARQRLEQLYKTKGYNNTTVEIIEGDKPEDRRAVFLINEGMRQKVFWVTFEGNTIASDQRLKTQIQTKPPILWVYKGYVDRQKIDADVDKLTAYYRSLGYFRARIGRELDWNEDQSWLTLRFVIDEGPRYVVRNISVAGNTKFNSDELLKNLQLKPGEYFDQPKMSADVFTIQDEYGSKGYIFANVTPDTRFLEEPGQLDLIFNIEEGDRYRVGRIDVKISGENNPHTRIRTVLNRMSLRPGDIVDMRELRASERRLKASQLFNVDPAKGVSPKIAFTPLENGEAAANIASRPNNARGQSPDPGQPYGSPSSGHGTPPPDLPSPNGAGQPLQPPRVEFPQPTYPQSQGQPATSPPQPRQPIYRGQSPDQGRSAPSPPSASRPMLNWQRPATSAQPQAAPRAAYYHRSPEPVVRGQSPSGVWQDYANERSGAVRQPASAAQQIAPQQQFPPQQTLPPAYANPPVQQFAPPPANATVQPAPVYGASPYDMPRASGQPPEYLPPSTVMPPPQNFGGPPPQPGISGNGGIEGLAPPLPGLFSNEAEPDQFVILQPTVEEARTGRLMFGVGVNSDAGLVGNVVLEEQNFDITRFPTSFYDIYEGSAFRGAGQRFRMEAVPGTEVQRYMFDFTEPYLFDTPISFGVSGFLFDRIFRDWRENRKGGQVRLGYQISPDLAITGSLRAEDVLVDAPRIPTPPEVQEVLGHTDLYKARVEIAHDTRDNVFLPTEGHRIELAFEQGFGEFSFPRATADVRQFFLIRQRPDGSGRHVLAVNGLVGISGEGTPVMEHFFAGGTTTLRGFRFRGASPVNMGTVVGGEFEILGSMEYLFPITADDALRGVVFCDVGTVEERPRVDWDEFRVAPGFGLRITVPALGPAPIALDLAFPIAHADTDDIQNFSFRVGLFR